LKNELLLYKVREKLTTEKLIKSGADEDDLMLALTYLSYDLDTERKEVEWLKAMLDEAAKKK